jgi:hypothetical protein
VDRSRRRISSISDACSASSSSRSRGHILSLLFELSFIVFIYPSSAGGKVAIAPLRLHGGRRRRATAAAASGVSEDESSHNCDFFRKNYTITQRRIRRLSWFSFAHEGKTRITVLLFSYLCVSSVL